MGFCFLRVSPAEKSAKRVAPDPDIRASLALGQSLSAVRTSPTIGRKSIAGAEIVPL